MRVRHRLLATMTALGLATALLVAAGSIWLIRTAVQQPFLERLRAETAFLAHEAFAVDPAALQAFAQGAARRLGVRVTLIAADGTVLGDSARSAETVALMDNHIGRPEVRESAEQGSGESLRVSDTTGVEYFYTAHRTEGGAVEYVRLALPSKHVFGSSSGYVGMVLGILLVSMVLMSAIAYAAVRRLSLPIETMADAVEQVADGIPGASLPESGGPEVSRLAQAVRRMQSTLEEKLAELDAERSLLSSVITGMRECLLVVSPDRRVRLANAAARRVFDLPFEPVGHLLAEVTRDPAIHRDVEATLTERREIRDSIVHVAAGRSFELHVTPLFAGPDRVEALVLLFDITRMESLERVRRQFVANVSHELRTPLTSIKAFVENLIDGGIEDADAARGFLEIVLKHTNRMGALIDDLTDLSLIETGAVRLDVREVRALEVVQDVVEELSARAASVGVDLVVEVPEDLVVLADRRRLEQALVNLVENAIKFNQAGGTVSVAGRIGRRPQLTVEDDGIGIPSDSQDKIFNRFYQVDPARSRNAGGTGLGLAIVKHLMRQLGGNVWVESSLGQGSKFTLEFASTDTLAPGARDAGKRVEPRGEPAT